jgi:hypothetical protein
MSPTQQWLFGDDYRDMSRDEQDRRSPGQRWLDGDYGERRSPEDDR